MKGRTLQGGKRWRNKTIAVLGPALGTALSQVLNAMDTRFRNSLGKYFLTKLMKSITNIQTNYFKDISLPRYQSLSWLRRLNTKGCDAVLFVVPTEVTWDCCLTSSKGCRSLLSVQPPGLTTDSYKRLNYSGEKFQSRPACEVVVSFRPPGHARKPLYAISPDLHAAAPKDLWDGSKVRVQNLLVITNALVLIRMLDMGLKNRWCSWGTSLQSWCQHHGPDFMTCQAGYHVPWLRLNTCPGVALSQ